MTNQTGIDAFINGWIDFNGDGDFEQDAADQLTFTKINGQQLSTPTPNGLAPDGGLTNAEFCFTVPENTVHTNGETHLRFRLSSAGNLSYNGPASDGEVEDYWVPLACVGNLVWHDVNRDGLQNEPDNEGINNLQVKLLYLGGDGTPDSGDEREYFTTTAPQDGVNGKYHFCGLIPGGSYQTKVPTPSATYQLATIPGAADVQRNSDGIQEDGIGGEVCGEIFTVSSSLNMTTNESSVGDASPTTPGVPDTREDLTFDFGFVTVSPTSIGTIDEPSFFISNIVGKEIYLPMFSR